MLTADAIDSIRARQDAAITRALRLHGRADALLSQIDEMRIDVGIEIRHAIERRRNRKSDA